MAAWASLACRERPMVEKVQITPHLAFSGAQGQVFSLNLQRLRTLSIYAPALEAILDNDDRAAWHGELAEDLGADPLVFIDRAALAFHEPFKLETPWTRCVVIAVGDFAEPERLLAGLHRFVGKRYLVNPPPFAKASHAGHEIHVTRAPAYADPDRIIEMYFAFPTPRLMVFATGRDLIHETLEVIAGQRKGLAAPAPWQDRLRRLDPAAMAWGLGLIPTEVNRWLLDKARTEPELDGREALSLGQEFRASLTVGREYLLRGTIQCPSIDGAGSMARDLEAARPILPRILAHFLGEESRAIPVWQGLLGRIVITSESNTVGLILRRTRREVEDFVREAISPPASPTPQAIPAPFLEEDPAGRHP